MTKTLADAHVGDIVHLSFKVKRQYQNGDDVNLVSTHADRSIVLGRSFPVDHITQAPWVPAVGDKCRFRGQYFIRIYTILGIDGNNWWLRDGDFYCSHIVDITKMEQVRE